MNCKEFRLELKTEFPSEDDRATSLLAEGEVYSVQLGNWILAPQVTTTLPHLCDLGTNELLGSDGQTVNKIGKSLTTHF